MSGPPWRMRTNLAVLVAACVLPAAIVAGLLVFRDYQESRQNTLRGLFSAARATAATLDRDLTGIESGLRVLAATTALAEDDLRAFHAEASHALPTQQITNYVLIDRQGQQRLNTLRPPDAPLPTTDTPPVLLSVFDKPRPVLSDLFTGPVTGKPTVTLGVPVLREGRVVYVLNAGLVPERLLDVIKSQHLPPHYVCAILDSRGRIVARSHDMARHIGRYAVPDLVQAVTRQQEGQIETVTLEGTPVVSAFVHSSVSGWSVVIGIPQATLSAGLQEALGWLVGSTLLLFSVTLGLAWWLARHRVMRPTDRLLDQMNRITLGFVDEPEPVEHRVREFASLQKGLDTMRRRLKAHDDERNAVLHRLETVLEAITDGFVLVDEQWCVRHVNARAESLLCEPREALLGLVLWDVLAPADITVLRPHFERAMRRHEAEHFECHLPALNLWLEVRLFPGETGLSAYLQDVSAVRAAREALEAQRLAEASSLAKTEFLSRMSHELRTPLNAVLGFAQLLEMDRQEPLSARQRERMRHIIDSGQHLLDMISEVLDVSRIESGTLKVQIGPVDAAQVARECEHMLQTDAARLGLSLRVMTTGSHLPVLADPTRLKQVMLNLMSNALKYNRSGGRVDVSLVPSQGRLAVEVRDTGLGMSADQLGHLFEPFNRLGREHSGLPGTGIGLVISQRLLHMMGGHLQVRSEEQVGTTFSFELPMAGGARTDTHAASPLPMDSPQAPMRTLH
ncbi:HAMP domain-containing protein [Aquabacterium lacunae]|uniref:histidine kinase n=1 Tax=Aquabacterium lacunae TaxID=2528630 RepID=A0A4Q9H275_9BURK|nr:ATP-binding protein [Aquabacterium lacunae]TBO27891.1 HAMP domain-containing protein [Aquabacterium lacunae]